MWGFFAALISGALMSIQGVFNTEVTKQSSLWVSTGWVQLSAFAVCVLAWLFTGRESISAIYASWRRDRRFYHYYGDPEHGRAGTGAGGHADRSLSVDRSLCDRAFWNVRHRQAAI